MDLATGIHGEGANRQMGVDLRLTLPGRCLFCMGGVDTDPSGKRTLHSVGAEESQRAGRIWHTERAGSLASLNLSAVALGLRLLEDLVAERIKDSVWLRMLFGPNGTLSVLRQAIPGRSAAMPCPVCRLNGLGDDY